MPPLSPKPAGLGGLGGHSVGNFWVGGQAAHGRRGGRSGMMREQPLVMQERMVEDASPRFPPGTPRRRLGNFRSPELAARVREVLADAGIPSDLEPDPDRPELVGRLLDRLVRLAGAKGNRLWVPRARFRDAVRALNAARRRRE